MLNSSVCLKTIRRKPERRKIARVHERRWMEKGDKSPRSSVCTYLWAALAEDYSQSEGGLQSRKRTGFKSLLCLRVWPWSRCISLRLSFFFCKTGTVTFTPKLWRWNTMLYLDVSQAHGRCSKHGSSDSLTPSGWLWVLAYETISRSLLTFGVCRFLPQELKRWH